MHFTVSKLKNKAWTSQNKLQVLLLEFYRLHASFYWSSKYFTGSCIRDNGVIFGVGNDVSKAKKAD